MPLVHLVDGRGWQCQGVRPASDSAAVAAVSEPLNRSTFPRTPAEVLLPTVETVELEPEQTLEAWANAHRHPTVALQLVYDKRPIPAR